ncbi:hypothetical protein RMSM_07825 [Rhodopirellula maiorica SM1]|uniref:Uncharacterized protein n=1 Tax=Rhodopirellula maiorica SM1 TaxID=1265738 RepID=M5RIQ0_9BACT|nr:hypothetical protein RMSM_07825 [Rhodopirellula maiorica SM1]
MSRQHGGVRIAWVLRASILRLQQTPVAFFGSIKMVTSGTKQTTFTLLQRFTAISDSTAKFKHRPILRRQA